MSEMKLMTSNIQLLGVTNPVLIISLYQIHGLRYEGNEDYSYDEHIEYINDNINGPQPYIYYTIDQYNNLLFVFTKISEQGFFDVTVDVDDKNKKFIGNFDGGGCHYTEVIESKLKDWKWGE